MLKNIYDEAIAEAALIREAAEDRAKARIIEEMTPQIKSIVEKAILSEESSEDDSSNQDENSEDNSENENESGDDSGSEEENTKNESIYAGRTSNTINLDSSDLSESSGKSFLSGLITEKMKKSLFTSDLLEVKDKTKHLNNALKKIEKTHVNESILNRFDKSLENLISNITKISESEILKKDNNLLESYLDIKKELNNMSRRRKRLDTDIESLFENYLFEGEEDSEEESGEEMDSEVDTDRLSGAFDDILSALGHDELEVTVGGGSESSDDDEDSDEDDEEEIDFSDLDMDMDDEDSDEDDEEDSEEDDEDLDEMHGMMDEEDEIIEIDESILRREIGKMKRMREGEAKQMASHFGGGTLGKEMFVDIDDSVLNVLANEIGNAAPVPKPANGKKLAESRNGQRKNRMLESKVKEYQSALSGMKEQLSEMNLFNAKLLYANKLMQPRQLTKSEQVRVVEALDEAKTLDRAKRVFERLQSELHSNKSSMNESTQRRVLSSSSRPVSSAQSAKGTGADLDRWARLAGLK
jgi:hypothetical protein